MKTKFYLFTFLFLLGVLQLRAQIVCNGESVRFIETFSTGNSTSALPAGRTSYTYNGSSNLSDGEYRLSITSQGRSEWHAAKDHTGDANGKMMVINAGYTAGQFYADTVYNLTQGANYSVSLYIMNVNTQGTCGTSAILPKLQFVVEYLDATGNYSALTTFSSGFIPQSASPTWVKLSSGFTLPGGITSVRYRIINNSNGGCGNDLALDDISFSQCASLSSLPVKGLSINTIETVANGSRLHFSTESEFQTNTMEAQKSSDGINWHTFHTQPASGNSERHIVYTSNDLQPYPVTYYRIRQTDLNGSASYSTVLKYSAQSAGMILTTYPTPFTSQLQVHFTSERTEIFKVTLYNSSGTQIQSATINARKGANNIQFNTTQLQSGHYVVQLMNSDGSIRMTKKTIKM